MRKKNTNSMIAFLFLSLCINAQNHELIWEESFNGYQIPSGIEGKKDGDNTTFLYLGDYNASFTKWTLDTSNADLQNFTDYAAVFRTGLYLDQHLRLQDTGGTGIGWITEEVSLGGFTNVGVNMYIEEIGDHEPTDYIDVQYSVDNGVTYIMIPNWNGYGDDTHTLIGTNIGTSLCLTDEDFKKQLVYFAIPDGSTSVKIKVVFKNGSSSENFILDDVKIFGSPNTAAVTDTVISHINIYPNPSDGNSIQVNSGSLMKTIQIFTIQGKLMEEITNLHLLKYSLNTKNLSNGLYVIKVILDTEKTYIQKLVIKN